MAPRGRPRKGQMRKDAAIDAMKSYGFDPGLINIAINELLDVYGLDGWPFIEEASYKVLLENLLEKVEKLEMEKGDPDDGNDTKALEAGPSSCGSAPAYSTEEANAIQLCSDMVTDTASETNNPSINALRSGRSEADICSLEQVDVLPRQRRRRPCHGWISNNDKEELIELQPVAPFPEKLAKLLSMSRKKRWDVRPENVTFSVTLE